MSLIRRIQAQTETVRPFTNLTVPYFGRQSRSGITMTRDRAMRISTVWSCVTVRAEDIGALPVGVVEKRGRNRIAKPDPIWLTRPNPETTQFQLFEQTSASIDLDGDGYWFKVFDRIGRIAEVWPLPPTEVKPYRDPPKTKGDLPGPKRFSIGNEDYGLDTIVHFPGFTLPGRLKGLNPIDYHAHTFALAAAAEEYGEGFFGNAATMAGVIELPNDPGDTNAKRMQDSFSRDHTGLQNAHKPGVLFGGAKWVQLTIPNDSAQFLETRGMQRNDICGLYRVPPHKIGDLSRATFSNIEQQEINYANDALTPRCSRIEACVVHDPDLLVDPVDRLKINISGRLRGDTLARYAAYAIARQWGWFSVDDIRDREDLDPLPNGQGETYLEPLNMQPVGQPPSPDVVAKALREAGVPPALIDEIISQRSQEDT